MSARFLLALALFGAVSFVWTQHERLELDRQRAAVDCEIRASQAFGSGSHTSCAQRFAVDPDSPKIAR